MTRKEAAGVIKFEKACVLRQDTPRCNRDCKKCDLLLPTEDVLTAYDMAIKALEQEPCEDIKEYYKDIWDCDINHPRYEDTVSEIVEKSYMSGYVQGVENTTKEFRAKMRL